MRKSWLPSSLIYLLIWSVLCMNQSPISTTTSPHVRCPLHPTGLCLVTCAGVIHCEKRLLSLPGPEGSTPAWTFSLGAQLGIQHPSWAAAWGHPPYLFWVLPLLCQETPHGCPLDLAWALTPHSGPSHPHSLTWKPVLLSPTNVCKTELFRKKDVSERGKK